MLEGALIRDWEGRRCPQIPQCQGEGGHPSGVGRGSLSAVKDQVIVPRGDSESRCKERLGRFQLSEHGGGGHMIFHSLFIGSRSIHGGQLQARLGGRLHGEWDALQTGREGQETRDKNYWGQVTLLPSLSESLGSFESTSGLPPQRQKIKCPSLGPTLA